MLEYLAVYTRMRVQIHMCPVQQTHTTSLLPGGQNGGFFEENSICTNNVYLFGQERTATHKYTHEQVSSEISGL